jgi:hypothetical protein
VEIGRHLSSEDRRLAARTLERRMQSSNNYSSSGKPS